MPQLPLLWPYQRMLHCMNLCTEHATQRSIAMGHCHYHCQYIYPRAMAERHVYLYPRHVVYLAGCCILFAISGCFAHSRLYDRHGGGRMERHSDHGARPDHIVQYSFIGSFMRIGKSALIGARGISPNKHIRGKQADRLALQLHIQMAPILVHFTSSQCPRLSVHPK